MLFVAFGLFGVNEEVWGAWSGSGQGVKKNGTWYVLYEDGEQSLTKGNSKDYNLSGPGASLTFSAHQNSWGTGDLGFLRIQEQPIYIILIRLIAILRMDHTL
jgi:hypothetical protein